MKFLCLFVPCLSAVVCSGSRRCNILSLFMAFGYVERPILLADGVKPIRLTILSIRDYQVEWIRCIAHRHVLQVFCRRLDRDLGIIYRWETDL
ncbi:hypothetical protein SCHPADRAFT_320027 [Schizopora paradoxa]|uniref:Secreted protein n=1 Tax=Schizopora paradoxa TaxID=27342 RepID=A0A0H2RRX1_9AGAM|nr:hypothetical protein SCHPADRAFT_320027 [Schizopora paradoxa]